MKTLKLLSIIILLSANGFAQSVTLEPNVFRLTVTPFSTCFTTNDIGKISYHTDYNVPLYCTGVGSGSFAYSDWIGNSSIYYNGKVGIKNGNPSYELDVFGKIQTTNLYINDKIGITTPTPTEKLEVVNREIFIRSTADATAYRMRYSDAADRFDIAEGNLQRLMFLNGGNAGIGGTSTHKLNISGDGNYAGNVVANGGSVMQNTSATQLKMVMTTVTTTGSFVLNSGQCSTIGFNFPSVLNFNSAPAVFIGQKTASGGGSDNHIIMTVESVTNVGGSMKFCNNSSTTSINNFSYSVVAIGN
jgi:hypothetical protein